MCVFTYMCVSSKKQRLSVPHLLEDFHCFCFTDCLPLVPAVPDFTEREPPVVSSLEAGWASRWADRAWARPRAAFSPCFLGWMPTHCLALRALCAWAPASLRQSFLHKLITSPTSLFYLVIGSLAGGFIYSFLHSLTYSVNKRRALSAHCPLDGMFTLPSAQGLCSSPSLLLPLISPGS